MAVDPARAKTLFLNASDLADPAERAAYLDRECGEDAELRGRVEALLMADGPAGPVPEPEATGLSQPAQAETLAATQLSGSETLQGSADPGRDDGLATVGATGVHSLEGTLADAPPVAGPAGFVPGRVIGGRYTLLEVLGEGGMGTVYRAEQSTPIRRMVALKLIKLGMDSRTVLARFDAERQALAMMDHPNIARVYDGGATDSGQPFFVMELVHGVPITDYCDRNRLPVAARLRLFATVCQAVQHAHQKGIIHRDLKPGNVMVAEVDGRPTPKVIDFGVAKATEATLTDQSLGDTGAIVGTPTYMSPEQADPSSMDIDTRTDVYALGVILYELLAGSPPLDASQFRRGALLEMLRMVREVDPPRPSSRLSTSEGLPSIAANRSIEPGRLSRLMQGELDWVVMKALEKDRTRRYDTANGLARDIQRYLADEVVEARPPGRGYRLKKFVKRNKGQVIAASLVFLALIGGIIGTGLGMASARRAQKAEAVERGKAVAQRDKAVEAERQAGIERDKALAAEAGARSINDFLTNDLLGQAEPANNAVEDKVTLLEVLNRAAAKVGTRFAGQPEIEESLRATIIRAYHGLASWEKAEAQVRALFDLSRRRDPRSSQAYLAQVELAHILRHRGRRDAEVLEMSETAVKGLERTLGPDHRETLVATSHLAGAYAEVERFPEAIALLERVRDAMIAKFGPEHPNTLIVQNNLAAEYSVAGQLRKAMALYERGRDAQTRTLGPDHPDTLTTIMNLAGTYNELGRGPEAIVLFERVRDAETRTLGPDHLDTLKTLTSLAGAYKDLRRVPEAIALYERVRDALIARLGPDHPDTLMLLSNLGAAYQDAGRYPEAIIVYQRALEGQVAKLGPDHRQSLSTLNKLASAYWTTKQFDKSVPLLEDLLKRREAKLGLQHADTQMTLGQLAATYRDTGRLADAIAILERIRDARIARLGPDHPDTVNAISTLATMHWRAKQFDKSVPLFEDLVRRGEARLGRKHPETQRAVANLGVNYRDSGRLEEAIPLLEEAHRSGIDFAGNELIDAYIRSGEDTKLVALLQKQLAEARKTLPKDSPNLAGLLAQIGMSLVQQEKWTEAESPLRECLTIREKQDPDDWRTSNTKSLLGGALLGQKKYADAEPLLLQGYEGMKQRETKIPKPGATRIPEAIDRLIELYTATDRPDEVRTWQAERANYPAGKPPPPREKP